MEELTYCLDLGSTLLCTHTHIHTHTHQAQGKVQGVKTRGVDARARKCVFRVCLCVFRVCLCVCVWCVDLPLHACGVGGSGWRVRARPASPRLAPLACRQTHHNITDHPTHMMMPIHMLHTHTHTHTHTHVILTHSVWKCLSSSVKRQTGSPIPHTSKHTQTLTVCESACLRGSMGGCQVIAPCQLTYLTESWPFDVR